MQLSLIAAMSQNRVIGINGELPWHLPNDFKHFKTITMGKPIVMGRKTYESIGKALPGRQNIVLTRQADFTAAGVTVAHDLEEALLLADTHDGEGKDGKGNDEIMIIGGAQIYTLCLPHAHRLYLTIVDTELEGDAFFPEWDEDKWKLVDETLCEADERHKFDYRFVVFERCHSSAQ